MSKTGIDSAVATIFGSIAVGGALIILCIAVAVVVTVVVAK